MKGASGGGGGQPNDVRAGGAFVEISARDRLTAQLAGIHAKAKAFAAGMAQVGKVTAFTGLAGLTPLVALFKGGLNRAEEASKLAEELGFSVEQMQRLKYAADVAGVSVEDVLRKPEKFQKLMGAATVLDAGQIREAVEAQQRMRAAWIDLQTAAAPLLATVTPLVRAFSEFVRENSSWLPVLAAGAAGLTALGVATFAFGKALGIVAMTAGLAGTVLGLLFTKAGLIIGALGGLAALVMTTTTSGKKMAGELGGTFAGVGGTFKGMMRLITDAIKAGDFETAFEAFTMGIQIIWYKLIEGMGTAFGDFIKTNHNKLVGLAALMAGINGAKAGGRFGPKGAAIAGLFSAGLAALTTDQILADLEKIGNVGEFAKKREELEKKLKELQDKIKPPAAIQNEDMSKRITAVRGAFRLLGDASQQFGRNDGIDTKQLIELVQIRKTLGKMEQLAVDAAINGRFK